MKIKIVNFGCSMNEHENFRIINYLKSNNYIIDDDNYDTIIVSCCAVTTDNEKNIKEFVIKNKEKTIYFLGCISPSLKSFIINLENKYICNYDTIDTYFPKKIIDYKLTNYLGSYTTSNIPTYLNDDYKKYSIFCDYFKSKNEDLAISIADGLIGFEFRYREDKIYKVKVSSGCSHSCNYCIIPKVKGTVKSRKLEEILNDIEIGYNLGYRQFLLLADDLASYGIDIYKKLSICDLLENIKTKYSDILIGLRYLEPMTLPTIWNDLKQYINDKFIFALNIPIQSGSNNILKEINRSANMESLKEIIKEMRLSYSGPLLTHVIVGFPFENIDDLNKTKEILELFDNTSIHIFSPRELTKFANYNIHENTKLHEQIILDYKKIMLAKYLKRVLFRFCESKKEISDNELEYRFKLTDNITNLLNVNFNDLKWSNTFSQDDIVFKNQIVDGFIIRFRHDNEYYMQIKIKKEEYEWKEISISIDKNDLSDLISFVKLFMDPMGVVSKHRKVSQVTNDTVKFYIDDVKHLGKFLEIEGNNSNIEKYVKILNLSISDANPPYGRILDDLNLDIEKEIQDVLKKI